MKILKSLTTFYNKLSNFGKILVFIAFLLITIVFFKSVIPMKEGMINSEEKVIYKEGDQVYDDFYVDIYDYLVFSGIKNDYDKLNRMFPHICDEFIISRRTEP